MPGSTKYRGITIEAHGRRWRWRISHGGRIIRRSSPTLDGAKALLDEALADREARARSTWVEPFPLAILDLCDAWFAAKRTGLAPGTAAQYEMHIRVHIKPELGPVDAHTIRPKQLAAFYATLRWKAAEESHNVLRQAFEWGIANEIVRRASNPCSFVRPSRRTSIDHDGTYDTDERIRPVDEKDIPTKSEVEKLLIDAETRSPVWWLYLKIASAIGARPGEVCALRRRDVDLENATIRVEWAADKVSGTVKRPKTPWSIRRLPVSRQLIDAIASLLPEDPDAFLFPSNTYRGARSPLPCWNSRSVKRRLDKAIARTGMKHITPHSFRHFVATQLLAKGMSPTQVARYLGHANDQLVRALYGNHIVDEAQREIGEAAGRLLD